MADLDDVEGAESLLAPAPLLPNLGKGSANVYWMDMTVGDISCPVHPHSEPVLH